MYVEFSDNHWHMGLNDNLWLYHVMSVTIERSHLFCKDLLYLFKIILYTWWHSNIWNRKLNEIKAL